MLCAVHIVICVWRKAGCASRRLLELLIAGCPRSLQRHRLLSMHADLSPSPSHQQHCMALLLSLPFVHSMRAAADVLHGTNAGDALDDVERCRNRRLAGAMALAAATLTAALLPQLAGCELSSSGCLAALMELHGLLVGTGESIAAAAVGSIPSAALEAQVGRATHMPAAWNVGAVAMNLLQLRYRCHDCGAMCTPAPEPEWPWSCG
jgi:hypothetical protein